MRLLLTRPEPEASDSAARLQALGHELVVAPVLEIVPLAFDWPGDGFDALIATSAHAFAANIPVLDVPVFAVGDRTAAAARNWNPGAGVTAAPDAKTLLALLRTRPAARCLYLAGQDRKLHLETGLAATPHRLAVLETYAAVAAKTLPAAAATALSTGQIDGALHYSRRSAGVFLDLASKAGLLPAALRLRQYFLSHDVAVPFMEAGSGERLIATRPDEASLFELLKKGLR